MTGFMLPVMTTRQRVISIATTGLVWLATAYLAVIFARAGIQKFSSTSGWAHAFEVWGFPVWFRILVGVMELAGAALVLIPRTAAYGAATIIVVMLGAVGTHLSHGEGIHEAVPLIMATIVLIGRRRARWRPARPGPAVVAAALILLAPAEAIAQSATFASLNGPTGLSVQRFDIDWPHSAVEFSVRFMGLSNIRGAFAAFGGTLMYNPRSITESSVSVVINTKSINTNVESRDRDLRSANFFDADKYPVILFHSDKIEKTADGFVARGPLTMHGVTRPVAVTFVQTHGLESDAWGNRRIGFLGRVSLNRKDFGILGTKFWNSEYDPGRMSISDNVDIELNIEAEVNQVEKWETPRGDSLLAAAATKGLTTVLSEFRAVASDTTSAIGKISGGILSTVTTKLMHRGKYGDAADAYKLAIELRPDAAWAHAGLGEAYLMSGRKTAAADSFRKAAGIDSTNTVASEYLRYLR